MVIIGSVAVNPGNGARLGKGEGRRFYIYSKLLKRGVVGAVLS